MELLNINDYIQIVSLESLKSDSNINDLISYGSYGIVYDKWLNNKNYIIKISKEKDTLENIKNIGKKYSYLHLQNISPELIKIYIYTNDYHNEELFFYGIIMEKYDTDLRKYLIDNVLTQEKINILENNISCLLKKIYHLNIIYTDVKFSNILINNTTMTIKLTDFDNIFCCTNTNILNKRNKKNMIYLLKMVLCIEFLFLKTEFKTIFYNKLKENYNLRFEKKIVIFINKMLLVDNTKLLIASPIYNLYLPIIKYKNSITLHKLLNLGNKPDNIFLIMNNIYNNSNKIIELYFIFMKIKQPIKE